MKNIKSLLTVAITEVKSRSSLLGAALVMGFFPVLFPTVGKVFGLTANYNDVGIIAYAIALCCAVGFSLLVGSSILGTDLASRRMSFYFIRPLSSLTVWGGKLLGALALIFGGSLIAITPSAIFFTQSTKQFFTLDHISAFTSMTLLCLGLGLVAGIIFRSRSFLLGLDLALVPITIVLGLVAFFRIITAYRGSYFLEGIGFSRNFDPVAIIISIVGLVMIVSSGIGLVLGRTDIKKVHRAVSAGLWGLMMAVVLSGLSFSQWVVSASPKDIVQIHSGYVAAGDKWLLVSGRAWGRGQYSPVFLLNPKTDEYVRMPESREINISDDGSRAIWMEEKSFLGGDFQLVKMNLKDDVAKPVYTSVRFPQSGSWKLSKDGLRAIVTREQLITAFDLNEDKELATVHVPNQAKWLTNAIFLNSDLVRLYYSGDQGKDARIFDFDIKDKKLTQVGQITLPAYTYYWKVSQDGEKLAIANIIYNGKTGEKLFDLSDAKLDRRIQFIDNGRFTVIDLVGAEAKLRVFSKDNVEEQSISLGTMGKLQSAYVSSQISENELALNLCPLVNNTYSSYYRWNIVTVNLKTQAITLRGEDVRPMNTNHWGSILDYSQENASSKPYFINSKGISRLDLTSGQQEFISKLGIE